MAEGAGAPFSEQATGVVISANWRRARSLALFWFEMFILVLIADHATGRQYGAIGGTLFVATRFLCLGICISYYREAFLRSQSLDASVFTHSTWRRATTLNLLEETDLTITFHKDGSGSIGYWRKGCQQFIKLLPDPTGRMQEALIEIGRQLPPGQFVDEHQTMLEGAN